MGVFKHYDLIRKPIITEKTTLLSEQNKFTFKVLKAATKESVKVAIEHIFAVKVKKVNILNIDGKKKRFKGREGCRADFKKAIVTLEPNYTIDFTGGRGK